MPTNNEQSKTPELLSKKIRLGLIVLGGVVGILVIYLVLTHLFPSRSEQTIKRIKESERISAGLVDYLNRLTQTQNVQLRKLFEKAFSSYEIGDYPEAIYPLNLCLQLRTEDEERVAVLIISGHCFYSLGNLKDAEVQYRRALIFAERAEDQNAKAAVWGNLGVTYQRLGVLDSAENSLKIHLTGNIFSDILNMLMDR